MQVVDEIYDKFAASKMGIESKGQVVLMIHCGSRGFGHQVQLNSYNQSLENFILEITNFDEAVDSGLPGISQVATDALVSMEKAMKRDKIEVNDRQLACARINSKVFGSGSGLSFNKNEIINWIL